MFPDLRVPLEFLGKRNRESLSQETLRFSSMCSAEKNDIVFHEH